MIRFRYNPAFKDYAALNRHVLWRRLRFPALFGGLAFAAYCLQPLAIGALRSRQGLSNDAHLGPPAFIVPIILVFYVIFLRLTMRKAWDKAGELRAEREYEIDEMGVRVKGESFSGFLEWRHIESAERAGGYYFLKTCQNQYYYFPESAVPEREVLMELLATRFPRKKTG